MPTNTGSIGQHKRGSIDVIPVNPVKKSDKKGSIWGNKLKKKKK